MRTLFVLSLFLTANFTVPAQGIDQQLLETLFKEDRGNYYCYTAVRNINFFLKAASIQDTIYYSRQNDGISFSYQGELLETPCNGDWPEQSAYTTGSFTHGIRRYDGKLALNGDNELRLSQQFKVFTVEVCRSYLHEDKITLSHYADDVLNDRYFEFSTNGDLLVEGQYQQVDSTWLEFIPTPDPDTYEVTQVVIERKKYPKKVGSWIYRSRDGDTLRVEKYPAQY